MVTQQVKAVKNVSKIGRIKKKSEGKTINTSSSFALCTSWMPVTARRCSAKQAWEPQPQPEHPRGVPPPKTGATGGKGSFATHVGRTPGILVPSGTASGSACEGIPSPLGFSYDAKESPAAPGASLSSLCTSLWRGQERDFLMHIQTKIPLFALHFFFFSSLKKSQKAQPT